MAITISYLNSPQNVRATLQDGGSLLANTTYYVIIVARNKSSKLISDDLLLSPPSAEVSFTTTDTKKSALIEWDSMGSGIYYDVLITKTSGNYIYNDINNKPCVAYAVTTNYYLITTTAGNIGFSNIPSYHYNSFGFSRNIGNIIVYVSGNETPLSVAQQIEALFPNNVKYYKSHEWLTGLSFFAICGSIIVNSGVSGSLNWGNVIFATYFGGLRNNSTSFTMSFGGLVNSNPQIVSNGARIILHTTSCYLYNIYFYGCHFAVAYSTDAYTFFGNAPYFTSGYAIDCIIDGIRIDAGINFSYSKIRNMTMFRSWSTLTNIKSEFHSGGLYPMDYYPRNGYQTYFDCIIKFGINTSSYHIQVHGYNNNQYGWISSHYDSKFYTSNGTGLEYIKFMLDNISGVSGMKFYYSVSANVRDKNGTLSNATVRCYDKNNNLLFEKTTDSNGNIEKTYVERLRVTFLGDGLENVSREWFTPLRIVVSKAGYQDLEITDLNFTEDTPIVLTCVMKLLPLEISSLSFTHPSLGNNDGTITIQAEGGLAPYEYSIDGGETFQSSGEFTGLAAGDYELVIKDDEGTLIEGVIVTLRQIEYVNETLNLDVEEDNLLILISESPQEKNLNIDKLTLII